MKYKIGMYGGSFDPLHTGHMDCIIKAASVCEKLYVILSYSRDRDHVFMEYRYRWLLNSFQHMNNIEIIPVEDTASDKEEYDWKQGRDAILSKINKKLDVVFCGNDYKGTNIYESLYECDIVYFERSEVPVSSTEIRENPFKYWQYIPEICRSYYTKKILIVGGESTGKSTLVKNLALYYNTNYLEEVGRNVSAFAGGEEWMIEEDFTEILIKHKAKEMELIKHSNKLLYVDTDALTTNFYIQFLKDNEANQKLAEAISFINTFDLVFFLEPTVDFIQDGTRNIEIRDNRLKYSEMLKEQYRKSGIDFICLSGDYIDRYEKIKQTINQKYGL